MTDLTPLAKALHSKVWPFVSPSLRQSCETISEENTLMNHEVPRLARLLLDTPVEILANVWGVHPAEAEDWRDEIARQLDLY